MAEKLCELKKKGGGGKYTETSLWTNPSPSSSFSPQTITLSEDINNYEYIGVKFNTDTTGTTPSIAIMSVTDYKKGINTGTSGRRDVLSIASQIGTEGNYYSRRVSYVSDTSANISAAKLYGSSTTSNTDVIPIQVVGIKVALPPTVGNVKTGSFISPTSGNTITITCGFEPKKIYLTMYASSSKMYTVGYDIAMDSTHQVVGWRASSSSSECTAYAFPNSSNNGVLVSISSTGFVYKGGTTTANQTVYYTVIG